MASLTRSERRNCHAVPSAEPNTSRRMRTQSGSPYMAAAIIVSAPSARRTTRPSSRPCALPGAVLALMSEWPGIQATVGGEHSGAPLPP